MNYCNFSRCKELQALSSEYKNLCAALPKILPAVRNSVVLGKPSTIRCVPSYPVPKASNTPKSPKSAVTQGPFAELSTGPPVFVAKKVGLDMAPGPTGAHGAPSQTLQPNVSRLEWVEQQSRPEIRSEPDLRFGPEHKSCWSPRGCLGALMCPEVADPPSKSRYTDALGGGDVDHRGAP